MPSNSLEGRDLYLWYQGRPTEKPVCRCIRVWDAQRVFMSELAGNAEQTPPVLVSLATEAEYVQYTRERRQ